MNIVEQMGRDPFGGVYVKVNLNVEIGHFDLIVRVGGTHFCGGEAPRMVALNHTGHSRPA